MVGEGRRRWQIYSQDGFSPRVSARFRPDQSRSLSTTQAHCRGGAGRDGESGRAAERHGELIAHASTKGGGLRKPEVMGIRRSPFAKETGLRGHELKMRTIAVAARLVQRQHALIHA